MIITGIIVYTKERFFDIFALKNGLLDRFDRFKKRERLNMPLPYNTIFS